MAKLCKLTGIDLENADASKRSEPFLEKMCLNCTSCIENGDSYTCGNEKVMEAGRKKIFAAVPDGFEIEALTLKPMLLKNPTKKCGNYAPNLELIHTEVDKYFLG